METSHLDVVYVVKKDENNEELRYSLRSLANLPHRKVFIVGYKPEWVKNVSHLHIDQPGQKYENVSHTGVFRTVCNCKDVSDDFIFMNDDFFIINKVNLLPNLRRKGTIEELIKVFTDSGANGPYIKTMRDTAVFLHGLGFANVDSYELHVPIIYNKDKYLKLRSMYPNTQSFQMRTLYGNYYHLGGERILDVKVYKKEASFLKDAQFLSTLDEIFDDSDAGKFIRSKFPNKSEYEK